MARSFAGCRVIDYGCGSGILAIAALKLGAAEALAFDIDPQARLATRDNAVRNGVADRLTVAATAPHEAASCDALVANILAGPLTELAGRFATLLRPGGRIALSGVLRRAGRNRRRGLWPLVYDRRHHGARRLGPAQRQPRTYNLTPCTPSVPVARRGSA